MRYVDLCAISLKVLEANELKLLYSIAVKNKVDAVDFFIDNNNMFITFESYLTGVVVTHKVKANIIAIYVKDKDDNLIKTSIDNTRYIKDTIHSTPSEELEKVVSGIDQKTYIRFSVITNILKAMAVYAKSQVLLDVGNFDIILSDNTTFLTFGRVRTFDEIEDYMIPFINLSWDQLSLEAVSTIAKALVKTKDTVYKMYIALEGENIYSHNTYFLIQQKGPKVNGKYTLPYTTIETIKVFHTKNKAFIGKKSDSLVITSSNIYISWKIDASSDETSNLLSILNTSNFIRIASIKKEEWDKVVLLKDYSDVDSDQDVTITFKGSNITASKENNRTTLKADTTLNDLSFTVGIDALMIARDLIGKRALLYIDKTGKDNVLVFYNEIMVVISLTKLKIEKLVNYQRYLNQTIEKSDNNKNNVNINMAMDTDLDSTGEIAEELTDGYIEEPIEAADLFDDEMDTYEEDDLDFLLEEDDETIGKGTDKNVEDIISNIFLDPLDDGTMAPPVISELAPTAPVEGIPAQKTKSDGGK